MSRQRCALCGWSRCPDSCPGSVIAIEPEPVAPRRNPLARTTMLGAGPGRLIIQTPAGRWMVDRNGWHRLTDRDPVAP